MIEKTIIMHDRRVYEDLRRQAKLNRRFGTLILLGVVYAVAMKSLYNKHEEKIQALMDAKGE